MIMKVFLFFTEYKGLLMNLVWVGFGCGLLASMLQFRTLPALSSLVVKKASEAACTLALAHACLQGGLMLFAAWILMVLHIGVPVLDDCSMVLGGLLLLALWWQACAAPSQAPKLAMASQLSGQQQ